MVAMAAKISLSKGWELWSFTGQATNLGAPATRDLFFGLRNVV